MQMIRQALTEADRHFQTSQRRKVLSATGLSPLAMIGPAYDQPLDLWASLSAFRINCGSADADMACAS